MPGTRRALVALLLLAPATSSLSAQARSEGETLRVFLDCQTSGCDQDYLRVELAWVDWVRDRQVADVHVLVTAQATGGGGRAFTLAFLGRGAFEGQDMTATFASSGDATDDDVRRLFAGRLAAALAGYALRTSVADRIRVTVAARDGDEEEDAAATDDPWDYWVFTVGLNGFLNGEATQSFSDLNGSLSANRTTEAWKLNLQGNYSRGESRFELDDRTVKSVRESWQSMSTVVRSLSDHWSAGLKGEAGSNSRFNQDFYLYAAPGVEYNVFPYSESTRRALTLQYLLGVRYVDWELETVFGRLDESRVNQALTAALDLNQPWGRADLSVTGSQYLHDLSKWRAELGGSVEVRLFKGFSFNVGGRYQWIRDQLHVPTSDLTDDEILLRQQQLATNFSYFTYFGIRYRFGSIFNNVVNTRFGGGYRPY